MTKLNLVLLIFLGYCIRANAQVELTKTVVASSGGNFANGALTLSSTVAEMCMVATMNSSGTDLYQGFQNDAWMIQEVSVNPVSKNEFSGTFYPNPASALLNIELPDRNPGNLTITLTDIVGRTAQLISLKEIKGKMELDVSEIPSGVYLISLLDQDNQKIFNQTVSIIH